MERLARTSKATTKAPVDPVCGMTVVPGQTKLVTIYKGHSYWFCAESCRKAFEANPQKYLEPRITKPKGPKTWWGRYLERVAKANREQFGSGGAKCH